MFTRDTVWVTKEFEEIPIKNMSTKHIKACLTLIQTGWRHDYQKVLEQELQLRKTPLMKALEETHE